VLIALDHRGLALRAAPGDARAAEDIVAAALAHLDTIRAGIRRNGKAAAILQTVPRPAETLFGSLDAALPGSLRHVVDATNRRIAEGIAGSEDLLFDVAGLAETVGLAAWHDHRLWNMAKLPFSSTYLPLYAEHACRILAALRGKSRRCLVLDLDDTLWGGVIGDDGLEGIVIGPDDATGEAHRSLQQTALALRERGIVLAVSSKNADDIAREPFRRHPDMLLREEHIAVFQANWQDKASNIRAIAAELSLGLDAMVLLDDNPAERALVRRLLPAVAVPELPADPALFARTLLAAGYFESLALSAEDRNRATFYRENARRARLQRESGDIDAYLASLDMVLTVQPFDAAGRARIAQLIGKSNQFNLTTRRYTEAEVAEAARDPACFTLQARLSDRFGDNGMIAVVICRPAGRDWQVDTWLMSCRVLGRRVENAMLQEILVHARRAGVENIIGTYRPTARNALVKEHYAKLGFALIDTQPDGSTRWALPADTASAEALPMTVRRTGGREPAAPWATGI
jgi:FkbH-like protein